MRPATSYLSRIRGVELLPGERVGALLSAESGLVAEPSQDGQLLVATDRRFISVLDSGTTQARDIFAITSVSGVSVRNAAHRGFSWLQWATLIAGGIVVYLALAYWLVDRLPPIIIPGINLHAFALAIMVLVVLAGWLFWRGFTQSGGANIRIYGANWNVEADCATDYADLLEFARLLSSMQSQRQDSQRPGSPSESSGSPSSRRPVEGE